MANLPGHADHGSILGAVGRWWRNWRHREFEGDALSGGDLELMARDVGVPASELKLLMCHPDDDAQLLRRRMARLRIDPHDISWLEGAVLRDMQRACTLCDSRAACIRDLARDPEGLQRRSRARPRSRRRPAARLNPVPLH